MRALAVALLLGILAGCSSPFYQQALEKNPVERPYPPMIPADERSVTPYDTHLFD